MFTRNFHSRDVQMHPRETRRICFARSSSREKPERYIKDGINTIKDAG